MKDRFISWFRMNINRGRGMKCEHCDKAMEEIMKSTEPITVTFRPDRNASNNITHYHIDLHLKNKTNE